MGLLVLGVGVDLGCGGVGADCRRDCLVRVGSRASGWSGDDTTWRYLRGRKTFIGVGCVYGCNISESIIMTRRPPTTETRTVLRTILSAGVLAVLLVLACAGTAAGATWVVDDDGGADFEDMQIVEAAA